MRSVLLLSTALSVVALLAFAREAFAADLSAVASAKADRLRPPGLIRGVMTDDVKALTDVGANSCMLWGPPGKPDAWDRLAEAKQFVLLGSLGPPKKEFFDVEGKKRVRMRTPYCWSNDFGAWWVEHVAEAAAKKYPAVCCVTPDECAWNNGIVPYLFGIRQPAGTKFYCDCDRCRAGAGGKLPEITASRFLDASLESKAFIRYRYKAFADAMKASLDAAKKADPGFLSYYCLNLKEVMSLERYPSGVALDMLPETDILLATCFQTSVDRRGEETRFIPALTTKHLLAARPRMGALPCLAATVYDYREKFDWTEAYCWRKEVEDLLPPPVLESMRKDLEPYKLRDDEVILPALSCVAHGAKGVMFFGDEKREALKKLFALMAKLEKPLAGATVPGEVVVLCSRQSEDLWMLAFPPEVGSRADFSDAMVQSGCWAQPADRIAWEFSKSAKYSEGFRSTQATMQALIKLGIPFRMHFVENLRAEDVKQAKAVILPFYIVDYEDRNPLLEEESVLKKMIMLGPPNRITRNAAPITGPHAMEPRRDPVVINQLAPDFLRDAAGRLKFADAIESTFDTYAGGPESVERGWLWTADGGLALFLINWSDKAETVQLRLPGKAKPTMLDTSGASTAIEAKSAVEVPARDARIIIQGAVTP